MLDHLLIWVNGRRHEIRGREAFLSLADYLRRVCGLTGTKIVCSEGDCGACSVLIGRAAADGSRLVYRPVDSCIQFLFQLDGTHIVTVEGFMPGNSDQTMFGPDGEIVETRMPEVATNFAELQELLRAGRQDAPASAVA